MTVSTFVQPDFTSQNETALKTAYDDAAAVMKRIGVAFAPHQQTVADMTVRLDAGAVFDGTTLTEVAAQSTATITAPSVDPRVDRVVVDRATGAVSVIAGAEAPSPSPPAITAGKAPVAQVALVVSQTEIVNTDLTDERDLRQLGFGDLATLGVGDGLESSGGNLRAKLDGASIKRSASGLAVDAPHERKTTGYTAVAADRGRLLEFDNASAINLFLTAASTLTEGWFAYVHNSGAGTLTIDPNGGELIDDATTIDLAQGQSAVVFCDGAAFWTVGLAGGGGTKEFFVPATHGDPTATEGRRGDFPTVFLSTNGDDALTAFFVPNDFTSITDAVAVVIPGANAGTANWDISSDYGAVGESFSANNESDTATTYNVTQNILFEIDISGILSALAAGDYVGIRVTKSGVPNFDVLGVRFKYT